MDLFVHYKIYVNDHSKIMNRWLSEIKVVEIFVIGKSYEL